MLSSDPRPPTGLEMGALVGIAAVTAAAVAGVALGGHAVRLAVIVAGAAAVLLGWPLVFWLLDHGRYRLRQWLQAGVLLGGLPLLLVAISGTGGLYLRTTDADLVTRVLEDGVAIPWYGVIAWRRFLAYESTALAIGLLTMAAQWRVCRTPRSRT